MSLPHLSYSVRWCGEEHPHPAHTWDKIVYELPDPYSLTVACPGSTTPAAPPELVVMTCGHGAAICALCDFIPSSWKPV